MPDLATTGRQIRGQAVWDAITAASGVLTRLSTPLVSRVEDRWLALLNRPELSQAAARIADTPLPQPVMAALVNAWVSTFDADLDEADVPNHGYRTLNDFFTRRLLPGRRDISNDVGSAGLISPCDGRISGIGRVDARGRIPEIKGRRFSVAQLIDDTARAQAFVGGSWAVIYLSPGDYHRVHCPISGQLTALRRLTGHRYPVNPRGVRRIPSLLAINERVRFDMISRDPAAQTHSRVTIVMVGATNVSRITTPLGPGRRVAAGDHLGTFNLGSTVVLLSDTRDLAPDVCRGQVVRMGQSLFRDTV